MATPTAIADTAHGRRFVIAWLVLSAIATPLVAIFLGPAIPPGNGSVQATEQVFDNQVMVSVVTPVCVLVLLFLGLHAGLVPEPDAGDRRRPAAPR